MIIDEYVTIKESVSIRWVVERSRFLAYTKEVASAEQARQFINHIKEEHRQATHNCSAYSVGLSLEATTFFDDDGEPGSSAGKPILGAILKQELTNVVVVVARYFGGKKLGLRGLIDAYGGVAEEALKAAGRVRRIVKEEISFSCGYDQINRVMYLTEKYNAKIQESNYGERVDMVLAIRKSLAIDLQKELEPYVIWLFA